MIMIKFGDGTTWKWDQGRDHFEVGSLGSGLRELGLSDFLEVRVAHAFKGSGAQVLD